MVTLPCLFFFFSKHVDNPSVTDPAMDAASSCSHQNSLLVVQDWREDSPLAGAPFPHKKKNKKKKQDICSDGAQDVHLECTSDPHRALCIEDVGMKYSLHSCLVEVCKLGCGCKNFLCMWGIVCLIF